MSDHINPDHYTRCKETLGVEVVDILDYFFGTDPHLWNAGKYLLRVGHKPGQDRETELGKAAWYIERARRAEVASQQKTGHRRSVRLYHLIGVYAVGSGEWTWQEEYDKLFESSYMQQLTEQIRLHGITEPVLLGSDGRVWDGHHRICAAMCIGLDNVPVRFSGDREKIEWRSIRGEL